MRTLTLADRDLFPPRNGETIPNAAHIRALSQLGEVDIASIGVTPQRPDTAPPGTRWLQIQAAPPTGFANRLMTKLRHVPGAVAADPAQLVERLIGRHYDLIYVTQLRLIDWAWAARQCLPQAKLILSLSDSPTEIHRRMWKLAGTSGFDLPFRMGCVARGMRLPNATRWEHQAIRLFDRIFVQSENDRTRSLPPARPIWLIASSWRRTVSMKRRSPRRIRDTTTSGCFIWGPCFESDYNSSCGLSARYFSHCGDSRPNISLHLVGAVGERDQSRLNDIPGVQCHGFVDDLQEMLQQSSVSIAPMMMRFGLINKIAESMAGGLPASGLGAFSGIPGFVNQKHGLEAHSAAHWVCELDQLLGSPDRLEAMSVAGRQLIESRLRWKFTNTIVQQTANALLQSDPARSRAA